MDTDTAASVLFSRFLLFRWQREIIQKLQTIINAADDGITERMVWVKHL